jgi:hypothetical protein
VKRLSLFLTILCAIAPAMAQQSLSGHLFSGNSGAVSSAFARLRLDNQGANVAKVSGTGILVQTQFDVPANSTTGVFSSSFWDNDHISPAGTQWIVEYWFNGQMVSQATYTFTGGGPYNLDSMAPNTTLPVIAAPTGDTTYVRVDNGNTSSWNPTMLSFSLLGTASGTRFLCFPDQLPGSWTALTQTHDAVCTFDINGGLNSGALTIAPHSGGSAGIRLVGSTGIFSYVANQHLFTNGGSTVLGIGANGTGLTINQGVWQSGTGFKHARVATCSTTTTSLSTCGVTITWGGSAFADTNYTMACTLESPNTQGGVGYFNNKTTTTVQVGIINFTSGTAVTSGFIDCIAIHD